MNINTVEGYPLEDFSPEAVKAQISEAQKVSKGGGSEQDIAEAKIELDVSFPSHKLWHTNIMLIARTTGFGESASRP